MTIFLKDLFNAILNEMIRTFSCSGTFMTGVIMTPVIWMFIPSFWATSYSSAFPVTKLSRVAELRKLSRLSSYHLFVRYDPPFDYFVGEYSILSVSPDRDRTLRK